MVKGRTHAAVLLGILLAFCACSFASDPSVKADFPGHREGGTDSTPHDFQRVEAQGGHVPGRDLKFTHLTTNDGLSENHVFAILQDHRGFMWFATEDGLNRYDGNTFVVYKNNPDDPGSLGANSIRDMLEDDQGYLWLAAFPGINKFDPATERTTRYTHYPNNPNSPSGGSVESIARDSRGFLWLATTDGGLDNFDPVREKFTHYRNDSGGKFVGRIARVIEDSHGEIWFVGARGLFHLNPQTGQIAHPPGTMNRLSANSLYEDNAGDFWMIALTPIVGLVKYDRRKEQYTAYPFGSGAVEISHARILDDGGNGLWAPSNLGLYYFDLRAEHFTYLFRHDATNPDSLDDNNVVQIYRDRAGLLWVGTEDGGVNILNFQQEQFGRIMYRAGDPNSLSPGRVTAIYEDSGGVLWVGFFPRALNRLDPKTGRIAHYFPDPGNPNALSKGSDLNSIYKDSRGYLWMGGWGGGLDRFDERTGQFRHFRHKPDDPASLISDNVLSVYEDRGGRLWVGHQGGVSLYDPETGRFTPFQPGPSAWESSVAAIFQDRSGTLWVGSWEGLLSRFDEKTKTFASFMPDARDPHKLPGGYIGAIREDRAGTLWVGTSAGVCRYNRQSETFMCYAENQGLPTVSNFITGILEDAAGRLWLGTKKGISRLDPRTRTFRRYDVSDGLAGNEFYTRCYQQGHNGEMFFCGSNGITAFFPENIRDNPYVPPVVLTSFKIFNQPVPVGPKSVLKKTIPYVDSLTLSYRDNVFSFEFAATSYANSKKNRYRYKLEGLEPGWNEVGSEQRLATYTNLDPGKYVFRVQGSNSDGVWNEEGVSLPILITPPWWRTNWFRALCAATFMGLLWMLYQLRVRQLAHQFDMTVEARVGERTRIARELHDTLLQSFQGLMLRFQTVDEMLPTRPLEAKEALEGALERADQAIVEGRDAISDIRGAAVGGHDLAKSMTTLMTDLSEEHAAGDGGAVTFRVLVEGTPRSVSPILQDEIYRIARESLRNAFRHAEARSIETEITYGDSVLRLRFRDDGKGIDPRVLERGGRSRHWGLPGIRERAKHMGAELEVWSELGAGTEVELSIPGSSAYVTPGRRRFWPSEKT
ncbi:MAG TPA: two-component regulator propeller domain-containing protein [Terriglobales bacterium]|nr:two-component regulator propeller domain-containing protein [Terriglobales bacterium]